MIANVDLVIDWLRDNDLKYWTVSTREGDNNKVFETSEDENFEQAVDRFRKIMQYSTGTRFHIKAKALKAAGRGMFAETFNNVDIASSQPAQNVISGAPGVGYVTREEMGERVSQAVKETMMKYEMDRIKEENAELKKQVQEVDNTTNRVMKKVEPYLGAILGNVVGKIIPAAPAVAVAGIEPVYEPEPEDVTETEVSEDDQERLTASLEKWAAADPDFIRVLEIIATYAASGQPIYMGLGYPQLKEMILKAVD